MIQRQKSFLRWTGFDTVPRPAPTVWFGLHLDHLKYFCAAPRWHTHVHRRTHTVEGGRRRERAAAAAACQITTAVTETPRALHGGCYRTKVGRNFLNVTFRGSCDSQTTHGRASEQINTGKRVFLGFFFSVVVVPPPPPAGARARPRTGGTYRPVRLLPLRPFFEGWERPNRAGTGWFSDRAAYNSLRLGSVRSGRHHAAQHGAVRGEEAEEAGPESVSWSRRRAPGSPAGLRGCPAPVVLQTITIIWPALINMIP